MSFPEQQTNPPRRSPSDTPLRWLLLHAASTRPVISLWLGHADVLATNAYLQAGHDHQERALALHHPSRRPSRTLPTAGTPSFPSRSLYYAACPTRSPPKEPSTNHSRSGDPGSAYREVGISPGPRTLDARWRRLSGHDLVDQPVDGVDAGGLLAAADTLARCTSQAAR